MAEQLNLFDHKPESDSGRSAVNSSIEQELVSIAITKDAPAAQLTDLVPDTATLALTRGYSIRAVHVARILSQLRELQAEGSTMTRSELGEDLGMTWAAAQSYFNVMRRMAFTDYKSRITPFGAVALSGSPRLDNRGLLWLLHFLLASDANLVLWSNLFNLVTRDEDSCTIQSAVAIYSPLVGRWSEKSLTEKARHELGGILSTYTDDLFSSLQLVRRIDTGTYEFYRNTARIPPLVWLSCILAYRDRYYPGTVSLEVPLVANAHFSPGRIMRQNEADVRRALDELHNADLLTVETRSGLDQIRFKRGTTWIKAIADHLEVSPKQ